MSSIKTSVELNNKMQISRQDNALMSLDNHNLREHQFKGQLDFSGEHIPGGKINTSTGKRLQFDKEDCYPLAGNAPRRVDIGTQTPSQHGATQATVRSAKRNFEEVDRSPEAMGLQAKRGDADFQRSSRVPGEQDEKYNTGLTGLFSIVGLGSRQGGSGGQRERKRVGPTQSSPTEVAKNLLCELEDHGDEVDDAVAARRKETLAAELNISSSLSETQDLRRSLSLDSEGSAHDMSVISCDLPPMHLVESPKEALSSSLEELDDHDISACFPSTPVAALSSAPIAVPKAGATPGQAHESGNFLFQRRLLSQPGSAVNSPSFLRPRNVVAFRSYCSSINRSNLSTCSRLSLGSVEPMETSVSASFHSSIMTPMQKKRTSCSSSTQQVRA